jgi:type IV pilus assembly protein PilW
MRARQTGMSLVEVLVAVAIGLIGILIITQVYLTSDNFNRSNLGEGGAQTNGLIALYNIERDIRNAGYGVADASALGCGELFWYASPNYSKNVNAGSPLERIFMAPVYIEPGRLTVMYATDAERMVPGAITGFTAATNLLNTESRVGFAANDYLVMVGNAGCVLAKVSALDPNPGERLQLNPGGASNPNPPSWATYPTAIGVGSTLINLGANPVIRTYSINSGKLRTTDPRALGAGEANAQVDVMDGIVDLRAQYGKDNGVNNGTVSAPVYVANDFLVDQYSATTPANSAEWQQVLSIRVGLLARIGSYEKPNAAGECDTTTVAPAWAGGTFPGIDVATATSQDRCYRYRVFETTVPLRNMIWRAS